MKKSSSVSRIRKGSDEALRFRKPGNNNLTGSMHENMDNNIEEFIEESRRKMDKQAAVHLNSNNNPTSEATTAAPAPVPQPKSVPTPADQSNMDPLRAMIEDMKAIKDELRNQLLHLDNLKESIEAENEEVNELTEEVEDSSGSHVN